MSILQKLSNLFFISYDNQSENMIDNGYLSSDDDGNKRRLPPIENPYAIPTKIEDFKRWHVKVLRRLNKHPVKEQLNGLITKEVDIPRFISILLELNLIEIVTFPESLTFLKNDTLKSILKGYHLQISGNKKQLIDRLLQNVDCCTIKRLDEYSDYYILTERGKILIEESYSKFDTEETKFLYDMVELILSDQIDVAYRAICKRNAETPARIGLGFDWHDRYYKGISNLEKCSCKQILKKHKNELAACAIYSFLSGESAHRTAVLMLNIHPEYDYNDTCENIQHISSRLSDEINFKFYSTSNGNTN